MGRKKKNIKKITFLDTATLAVIKALTLVKWLGDLIIALGRFSLLFIFQTYKTISAITPAIIQSINRWIQNLLKTLKKLKLLKTLIPPKTKRKKKKKTTVIFSRKLEWLSRIKTFLSNLLLYPVKFITLQDKPLLQKLKKLIPSAYSVKQFLLKVKYFSLGALCVVIIALYYQTSNIVRSLPNPIYLSSGDIPTTTKIYDRNGRLLYEVYAEKNRTPVKLSEIPDMVKKATIAIEDTDFYNHKGFSPRGIVRAIYHNLTSDKLEGASTITQQLVRSTLLTPEKTLVRKAKELAISIWTEQIYTKDQILEMYLNQVAYGGTSWGIEAASQTYFGKSVKELKLEEAALLAGLPAAPTKFSPFSTYPQLTKARQEEVLNRMVDVGFISKEEAKKTKKEILKFKNPTIPIAAPHFVMYVREMLEKYYGLRAVSQGGLRVTTTLDLSLQEKVQKIVFDQIGKLKPLSVTNGAVLITHPDGGEILAMIGSIDYFDKENEGNVNVTTSQRQPGSSIKVVNYAKALEIGFTTASIINDSPITYRTAGQPPYSPVNYDSRFHGKVSLRTALASSYNVPAVKVLAKVGVKNMIEQGKLMGIDTWEDEGRFGLSLTLGGGEVTMLDMAEVYGTLANKGKRKDLTPFLKITNWQGENISLPFPKQPAQAVSAEVAFLLSNILSDNRARTPAFGPNSTLVIPEKTVAVKTGTSDNKRDNWTIGYTPDYVVVVWVGNNDNSPMHPHLTSGVTGAAPIWHETMEYLLKEKEDKPFFPPENIVVMPCRGDIEYFIKGTEPKAGCPPIVRKSPTPQSEISQ